MMRDAVTEINIESPAAKEAFIRWWRMMETQGYNYGYEALCNVWVGFDDGRSDLARKILETMESERAEARAMVKRSANAATYRLEECKARVAALNCAIASLYEMFIMEGVTITEWRSEGATEGGE